MEPKKNYHYPTPSNEHGWVLAFVLLLLAVILGLTMASASIMFYHMKSSNAFYHIIKGQLFSPQDGNPPSSTRSLLGSPEGWDHICFFTELTEQATSTMRSYSWRVAQREQCPDIPENIIRTIQRPYIVVIIDDSLTMNASSDQDYRDEALYIKQTAGSTVHISDTCELADTLTCAEGMYFRGSWGNSYQRAPAQGGFSGAMSVWAKTFSYARSLISSLELCEVALISTSHGTISPFTMDWQEIMAALDSVHPSSGSAPLAEALYQATTLFPSQCVTDKHILLVTAGVPVKDGHLPSWLMDYDHDGNSKDIAFEGEGSHCLDDVSAYAKSLGIHVHAIGRETDYLKNVAAKGGGRYMPGREIFAPEKVLVTQPMVLLNDRELTPSNCLARFDPPWLKTDPSLYYRQGVVNPFSLVSCPDLVLNGLAHDLDVGEDALFFTTSRDQLIKITMPTGELTWLVTGIGGAVLHRGDRIIAGPNRTGFISCIAQGPQVLWQLRGTCMDASDSTVYIGNGSLMSAYNLEDGMVLAQLDLNRPISVVRYDPCTAQVFTGTSGGLVSIMNQRLEPLGIINTVAGEPIMEIRPFTWRKRLHLITASRTRLECHTPERIEWSVSLEDGSPTGMAIMDNKIFLSTWREDAPCGGIDTGVSKFLDFDALTGKQTGTETMFIGRSFGPSLDPDRGVMKFISPTGKVFDKDISKLPGIIPCTLGRRLVTHIE